MQKKTVETRTLSIAYLEDGPPDGPVILLLHGWPDDATTWDAVMPPLAAQGYRVIAPWLRGFGDTRFRWPRGFGRRTANSGIMAFDAIAMMDKLQIGNFTVIGHDWGVGIAESLAVGWPQRIARAAFLSSPLRLGGMATPSFPQDMRYWYHWFQATKRGQRAVKDDPIGFSRIMWDNWSPPGWYDEPTFQRTATSWRNPDFVPVTLHSYQARWEQAKPAWRSFLLEQKVMKTKTLGLPSVYIQGDVDDVNPPGLAADIGQKFTGPFQRILLPGIGHFPSREAPDLLVEKLLAFVQSS